MGLIEIWGGTTNWQFQLANFLTMMFDQLICTLFTDKHMLGSRQAKFVAETILCDMGMDQSLYFLYKFGWIGGMHIHHFLTQSAKTKTRI